jgi:hypothetical protein
MRPSASSVLSYTHLRTSSPTTSNPTILAGASMQSQGLPSTLPMNSPLNGLGAPRFRSLPSTAVSHMSPISPLSPSNHQSSGPQSISHYPHSAPVPASHTQSPPSYIPHSEYLKLLTPSGHALAIGGRVRNISTNPMSPCVIWWPDNERLPEQGCIRPLICGNVSSVIQIPISWDRALTLLQQPPIMNTGNRGPIEHQPGDWLCGKCHYLVSILTCFG